MASGGGKKQKVKYVPAPAAPVQQDNSMVQLLAYMQGSEARADARAAAERAERKAAAEARKAAGEAGLSDFGELLKTRLSSNLITETDAESRLRDYAATYGLDPGGVNTLGTDLSKFYTSQVLPERQVEGVKRLIKDLYGREATQADLNEYLKPYQPSLAKDLEEATYRPYDEGALPGGYEGYTGLASGYTSLEGVRESILASPEYKKTVNDNYLDNYYDTKFGSQVLDEEGNRTKRRTFKFNKELLPSMDQKLLGNTGITMPNYETAFGDAEGMTVAELEENLQGVRDTRNFLYNAGLTNLQGEIDTNITKLKTESAERITDMQKSAGMMNLLTII